MAEKGNPASVSDVGVGALATRACVEGAMLNVRINLAQLRDEKVKSNLLDKMREIFANSSGQFLNVFKIVVDKLNKA
jgi:glutamate formiminotransferase/formiminotetrahydrofolate cyclodeaminase